MRTPELKKTILRIIGKREFYGYEMHRELEERNIILGIGRLYSILTEMNDEGLLKDRWEKSSSGPKRRVYKIGKKGEIERSKILMDAIRTVHEFYMEYLLDLPPENSVFNIVGRILTRNVSESSNFGYIASRFSGPLMRIIGFLREKLPTGKKYAIAQQASELNLEFDDVFAVEGTFDDIPMKDNHLDLLVITGNIGSDCLDDCLSEWQRVLTKDGSLAIIAPTATITSYQDPIGIGEFIEQREHPPHEDTETLNSEMLKERMKNYFETIEEVKIIHLTILLGLGTK